ncbi:MAG: hypothetical protein GZ086_06930 [Gelidibacter sp.]|nr:hypothetical protein [Gelidibacter sp.]
MVNANSNTEIIENIDSIDLAEGTPSDCVRSSRNAVLTIADDFGWDVSSGGSEFDFAMDIYMSIYTDCLGN